MHLISYALVLGFAAAVTQDHLNLVSIINNESSACITRWDDMLSSSPPCLKARRVWLSDDSKATPSQSIVTLVTQLSLSRLPQLHAQCATWLGPLTAAIYVNIVPRSDDQEVPSSSKLDEMLQKGEEIINDKFNQLISLQKCQPRLILLYEVLGDKASSVLYPVNTLRNYARLLSTTPLIANIDVDMLPSLSLSTSFIKDGEIYTRGSFKENKVYVIPAFETACGGPALADKIALLTKTQLQTPSSTSSSSIYPKCLSVFRSRVAPACHNATNIPRWFSSPETSPPYPISYEEDFEPWFIGGRIETPWFDTRFRGYGKNKISHVAATASKGHLFEVHPNGFLVHRAHTESISRKDFLRVKFKSRKDAKLLDGSLFNYIETIWNESRAEMRAGSYQPRLDPALLRCLNHLSWGKRA